LQVVSGSEAAYQKLGRVLEPGTVPTKEPKAADPIKTKFKIDIISGTSAGGINGIYLAKALATEAELNQLEELWIDEGGIDELLNDRQSYSGLAVSPQAAPQSLLNSRRMYIKLLEAFDGMTGDVPSGDRHASRFADELDLYATTTDIEGVPVPIRLLDNVVYERRFRNVFHFRFNTNERDDFQADNNPFLAFAARCTSSFPFAFEPMRLRDMDEVLSSNSRYSVKKYCFSASERWQKFYVNYLQGVYGGATEFPDRSFGDGGYLNNAPFSYAVDSLLTRQADLPVSRKLLYVEPSPAHPEETPSLTSKPNAVENSLAALVTIPGYQTIRNDLARVLERNRSASRINTTLGEIERRIQQTPRLYPPDTPLEEIPFQKETSFGAYYQMRASDVTDRFATILARALWVDEDSILFIALRSLIRAWRERHYYVDPHQPTPTPALGGSTLNDYLVRFDLPYRVRRLRFVLRKLDTLYGFRLDDPDHPAYEEALDTRAFGLNLPEHKAELLKMPAADLMEVRVPLAQECSKLQRTLRQLLERRDPEDGYPLSSAMPPDDDPRVIVARALPNKARHLLLPILCDIAGVPRPKPLDCERPTNREQVLLTTQPLDRSAHESRLTDLACDRRAADCLNSDPGLADHIDRAANVLADWLAKLFRDAQKEVTRALGAGDAGRIARRFYQCFDYFDCVQFPMMFGTDIGEPDIIDIIRICPEDAPALMPELKERRAKLKGLAVAHFGAFLDRDWRVSDLLWGRLDGAERIITALLPLQESADLRKKLIDEAHEEILTEFKARPRLGIMALDPTRKHGAPHPQQLIDAIARPVLVYQRETQAAFMSLWQMLTPSEPDRVMLMRALARGTTIVGNMLDGIAGGSQLSTPAKWLANSGRALWALVEISVPRHWGTLLGKYWQSLLLLVSIILILAGLLSAEPAVLGFGWAVLGFAVLLLTLRTILWDFMRAGNVRTALGGLGILIIASVVVVGGLQIYNWAGTGWEKVQTWTCRRLDNCPGQKAAGALHRR
jgi:patatin-related protein